MPLPQSKLGVGRTGSGKTLGELPELLEHVEDRNVAIIVLDHHGHLSKLFAQHLKKRGRTPRLLYDELGRFERVLAPRFLIPSKADNPIERQADIHKAIMAFLDVLWTASGRDDKNWHEMPTLSMYLELGARLFVNQPEQLIPRYFPYVFRPKHPVFHYLLANTFDEEAGEEFEEIAFLEKRGNYNLLDQKIGPAKRLTRQDFSFPEFDHRMASSLNVGKVLRNKKIVIVDASSVPKQAAAAVFRMWNCAAIFEMERHYALTGEPTPVIFVWEEAADINMIRVRSVETSILRAGRKFGATAHVLSQDLDFEDPAVRKIVVGNTTVHKWYNPGDPELALFAALDLGLPQLDPYRIHSETTTERALPNGHVYQDRHSIRTVEGVSKYVIGEERISTHRFVTDTQTKYVPLNDQPQLIAKKLQNMPPGWRMTRISGKSVSAEPEYSAPLPDPYPEDKFPGVAAIMLRAAIHESQRSPEFITPVELDTSWAETTTTSHDSATNSSGNTSTFTPLPWSNSSKQESTQPKKRRGNAQKGGRAKK